MIKKLLKALSNYPRLRILLLIVLVIIIFILLGNIIGSYTSKRNVAPSFPASQIQTPQGAVTPAPRSLTTAQYQALSNEVQKAQYEAEVDHGQSILSSAAPVVPVSTPKQAPSNPVATNAPVAVAAPPLNTRAAQKTPAAPAIQQPQTLSYQALVEQVDQSAPQSSSNPTAHLNSNPNSNSNSNSGNANVSGASEASGALSSPDSAGMNPAEIAMKRALLMREPGTAFQDRQYVAQAQNPEAVADLAHSMQSQMQSLSNHWSLHPLSTVSAPQSSAAAPSGPVAKSVVITAGSVYYGVLMTAVDSDQPSAPILAQIVSGPFNGARLMGGFKLEGEKLVVNFTSMTLPHMGHSISINAYAINGVTAQNALASNVDHHYLYRYGSLFAAAFMEGFGNAYSTWNPCAYGVTTCTIIGNDVAPPPTTTQQAIYHGVGQVGTTMGQEIGQNFNTPPTVTLDQGMGIGVLFMQDVAV